MKNLEFLVAAYSAVWIIISAFLLILLKRNKKLRQDVSEMESRIIALETKLKRQS